MGKLWVECSKEELILAHNKIKWSLKERMHAVGRIGEEGEMKGKMYVIPQYMLEAKFEELLEPGCNEAKENIEKIYLEKYKTPVPEVELIIIAEEEWNLREMGWEAYKAIRMFGLQFNQLDKNAD